MARAARRGPPGWRCFVEIADVEYVAFVLAKACCRAWVEAARERFGGAEVCRTLLSASERALVEIGAVDAVPAAVARLFEAVGRRDVTILGRRFVALGDEEEVSLEEGAFFVVDRRHYGAGVKTQIPAKVAHFLSEHGHTIENRSVAKNVFLKSARLPRAITIGRRPLTKCSNLRAVSLPMTTRIAFLAFAHCTNLTSISLPAATTIGQSAFLDCSSLSSVSVPVATVVGIWAFSRCTSLTSISLPAAVTIGYSAFHNCASLTTASLPAAVTIGEGAFEDCDALATLEVPEALRPVAQTFLRHR